MLTLSLSLPPAFPSPSSLCLDCSLLQSNLLRGGGGRGGGELFSFPVEVTGPKMTKSASKWTNAVRASGGRGAGRGGAGWGGPVGKEGGEEKAKEPGHRTVTANRAVTADRAVAVTSNRQVSSQRDQEPLAAYVTANRAVAVTANFLRACVCMPACLCACACACVLASAGMCARTCARPRVHPRVRVCGRLRAHACANARTRRCVVPCGSTCPTAEHPQAAVGGVGHGRAHDGRGRVALRVDALPLETGDEEAVEVVEDVAGIGWYAAPAGDASGCC
jgi:hypothetical protein